MIPDTPLGLDWIAHKLALKVTNPAFQRTWAALQEEGWTEADIRTSGEARECLRNFKMHLAAQGERRGPRPPAWIQQAHTLARYAVELGSRDDGVVRFRAEVLDDRLLGLDEVFSWMQARAGVDLTKTIGVWNGRDYRQFSWSRHPDLRRLAGLTKLLAQRLDWRTPQAATFILCGAPPPLRWPIRVFLVGQRLRVDAAPWVPSDVVAETFAREQRRFKHHKLHTPITERSLRLVDFVSDQGGRPSRGLCRTWNKTYPKWRYATENNFIRDFKRCLERLLETSQETGTENTRTKKEDDAETGQAFRA